MVGIVNILSIIDISKIKHFVHLGSSEEYGLIKSPQLAKNIGEAYTPYSYSKQSVTNLLKMLKYNEGLKFTVARVFSIWSWSK